MSAQSYWGTSGGDDSRRDYDQPQQHHQYQQDYSASYRQDQSYQPHHQQQQQPHQQSYAQGDGDEQLNWGYGDGGQHYQQPSPVPPPSQDYYGSQGPSPYEPQQQHSSYDDQNRGYGQSYQNHSQQPQDQYQVHQGYPGSEHHNQPPAYDYNRQPSPNPHQSGYQGDQGYSAQSDMHQPYPGAAAPADGERGLLGAVGGAVAGGYAGHQAGHGFLGAVGGAYAGHKLEDHVKDKKKKKKDEEKHGHEHGHHHQHHHSGHSHGRRGSSSSSSSSSSSDDEKKQKKHHHKHGGAVAATAAGGAASYAYTHHHSSRDSGHSPAAMAGNFSSSSTQISLDRDYDLIASCATVNGHGHKLSSIDLNDCLTNSWGQLQWARGGGFGNTSRNVRLVDGGRVLEAEVGDGRGGWNVSRIRLDERITNNDGDLQFLG